VTDLLIDGEVFCLQRGGGVSRIYEEVIPRIVHDFPDISPTLFLRDRPMNEQSLALGARTKYVWHPTRRGRGYRVRNWVCAMIDEHLVPTVRARIPHDVFFSSYFTLPPREDVPAVVLVYDMIYERFPELFEPNHHAEVVAKKRRAIERASLVLCISEASLHDVVELIGVPKERCRVVYLSGGRFASQKQLCAEPVPQDRIRLLYVGQYGTSYKNFEFLLKALSSASRPEFRSSELRVVCKNRPPTPLLRRYEDAWPEGTLIFDETCDDQQLADHYLNSTALVYPSLYEGFGLPPVEAHSLGIPVVCSDIPVFREIGGDAYFLFDPTSTTEFESALSRAASSRRSAKDAEMRRKHAAQFTWERTTEGIVSAIQEVAAQGLCAPRCLGVSQVS